MRVLFVAHLWDGSTSLQRMQSLESLGLTILPFDLTGYSNGSSIERSLLGRFNYGRSIGLLNEDLIAFAQSHHFDALWVDKGVWVYPATVTVVRALSTMQLAIHSTPDAQIIDNRSRHFINSIPHYDLLVTTKPFELDLYRRLGAKDTLLILQGYGQRLTDLPHSALAGVRLSSEICFIGHFQNHYRDRIRAVSRLGANLKVWGPRWPRYARYRYWLCPIVQGDGLWGDDYPRALHATKIALGLLGKHIPETTTTRTFEIPATGTFMLAERTKDHQSLFEEGKEAEFFSDDEELVEKVRFYLDNDGARQAIASAGRERCFRSGYDTASQLHRVLAHLERNHGIAGLIHSRQLTMKPGRRIDTARFSMSDRP